MPARIIKHLHAGRWILQLVSIAQDGRAHIVAEIQIDNALGLVTLAVGFLYDVAAVSGLTVIAPPAEPAQLLLPPDTITVTIGSTA